MTGGERSAGRSASSTISSSSACSQWLPTTLGRRLRSTRRTSSDGHGRERWVVLRYELGKVGRNPLSTPDLRVVARFPQPSWGKEMPTRASVVKLFEGVQPSDASEPFADSELALADVAEPTSSEVLKHKCR
jgi:hypothetical protein